MKNIDLIKQAPDGEALVRLLSRAHGGCRESIAEQEVGTPPCRKVWKHLCCGKYNGIEGCAKCKAEYWNMEVGEFEQSKQYEDGAEAD